MKIDIGGGVRLYVDVDGAGLVPDGRQMREKPTLICMHGGPGFDHSAFKPAFGQLTDLAQVVYYDHRGHGRSDPRPSSEWTLDVWADDVVRLCDALGIEKPIVLGQSFGGFVAQRYIAKDEFEKDRIAMIEMLWEVAFADGQVDHFESNLIQRIGGLLFVTDRDRGLAKQRVMARLGIRTP